MLPSLASEADLHHVYHLWNRTSEVANCRLAINTARLFSERLSSVTEMNAEKGSESDFSKRRSSNSSRYCRVWPTSNETNYKMLSRMLISYWAACFEWLIHWNTMNASATRSAIKAVIIRGVLGVTKKCKNCHGESRKRIWFSFQILFTQKNAFEAGALPRPRRGNLHHFHGVQIPSWISR